MSILPALRGLGYCLAIAAAAAASAAPVAAADTPHTTSCWSGYSYNGVQSAVAATAVAASIRLTAQTFVDAGHVAAWVGVGGAGLGPGGSSEWLQAGIARDAGGGPALYYELKRPQDRTPAYVTLAAVAVGDTHAVAVVEIQRDVWVVTVDGARVSAPAALPGSHGAFRPIATTESWDGGAAGTCNRYSFDFSNLTLRTGAWQPFDLTRVLHDPAYLLTLRAGGFTASSR